MKIEIGTSMDVQSCASIMTNLNDNFNSFEQNLYNLSSYMHDKTIIFLLKEETEKQEIKGFCIANIYFFDGLPYGIIDELVVTTEVSRQGYGSLLIKCMEKKLKELNCKLLCLESYNEDVLKKFYMKNEYLVADDRVNWYKFL